ncbi:hypothetical protein JVU11DRAFT_8673 [Chiua virens]|nr:hypothetical protein JVU11DRAFT_8673 [Chiua virens]
MLMSISPSSHLRSLERHNHSKSTVSSSDADADSAGYASSSGTTTPEDDAQTFHLGLGPSLQNVLADKTKNGGSREKLAIVTKQRNFSLTMKKVKKVAHALAVFKRKRPDDISPILISSPLRERFGKRMSIKALPDESTPEFLHPSKPTVFPLGREDTATSAANDPPQIWDNLGIHVYLCSGALPASSPTTAVPQTRGEVALAFSTTLRILFFVPWCVAVGGALLLFPNHVELVAFRTGYLPSQKGLRRFAHWAECGEQHVLIFLASLVALLWYDRIFGLSLTSIVVSRLVWVWHGFKVDRRIPLGEDDRQSLYLVVMGLAFADTSFQVIKQGERQTVVMGDASNDDSG